MATYAEAPRGIGLTPPFETEGHSKYANQPILILGGACSLGQYGTVEFPYQLFTLIYLVAIQLANLSGFNPIITTASLKNSELLSSLGATHVIERELPEAALKEEVKKISNAPLTYIFDAVSLKETQQTAYDLLAPGGTVAVVQQALVEADETSQKKVLMVYGTFHVPEVRKLGAKFAKALTKWLAEGKIKVCTVFQWRCWVADESVVCSLILLKCYREV